MNATTATTSTTAAAPGLILALDLGKYKSVACLYDRATARASFATLTTARPELPRLLERHRPALVVIAVGQDGEQEGEGGRHGPQPEGGIGRQTLVKAGAEADNPTEEEGGTPKEDEGQQAAVEGRRRQAEPGQGPQRHGADEQAGPRQPPHR